MTAKDIESATGLPAHKVSDFSVPHTPAPQQAEVYPEHRGPVAVPVVEAGPHTDDRTPAIPRKREHEWPEVHDPFDTTTAEVDSRSSGDPIGSPRGVHQS